MKTNLKKLQHKASGTWFWMNAKLAWGKAYFSADGEKTWHATKTEAYRAAIEDGTLEAA